MSLPAQNLPKLLNTILNSFIDLCGCDGGSIYTLRKNIKGEPALVFETMTTRSIKLYQVPEHLKNMSFALDESTLVGKTAVRREFCQAAFNIDKPRQEVDDILAYQTRNILSAPLITPRGDLVGVVQLLNKLAYAENPYPEFDSRDERLFSIVAGQAALAIENSLLLEEQEKLLEGFMNAFVTAVEARDPITSGHSTRVSEYTVGLGEAVNRTQAGLLKDTTFSDIQMRELRFAAMLHDIGKISVKEDILNKEKKLMPWELEVIRMRLKLMRAHAAPEMKAQLEAAWKTIVQANEPTVLPEAVSSALGDLKTLLVNTDDGETLRAVTEDEGFKLAIQKGSLTAPERKEIELHVTHTFEILKMIPWSRGLEGVPEIAHYHHEKLDGTGYPCKISAPQIPVQSRMLAICDIYDALTADDRPYKRALSRDKALEILATEVMHKKLDSELFKIFLEARIHETVKVSEKKANPLRKRSAA